MELEYKGYKADVKYEEDTKSFHIRVNNIIYDVISFDCDSIENIEIIFAESIEDYFESCIDFDRKVEQPQDFITDGHDNYWYKICEVCGEENEIIRIGKVQCGC